MKAATAQQRTRADVVIRYDDVTVLVDATPAAATAMHRQPHRHDRRDRAHAREADHIMGLDDVPRFNAIGTGRWICWADARTHDVESSDLRLRVPPAWPEGQMCFGRMLVKRVITGRVSEIAPPRVGCPIPLLPRRGAILGFRVGFAYCTDVSRIPDESLAVPP